MSTATDPVNGAPRILVVAPAWIGDMVIVYTLF